MDAFIDTEGLWHIPEFIFGLLNYEDLTNCSQVSTKWKWFLTRQHGIFEDEEKIKEDLNFVLTKKVSGYGLVHPANDYAHSFVIDSLRITITKYSSKTILEHYPDFRVVMDHFQSRNLSAFKAFLSEIKTMLLESPVGGDWIMIKRFMQRAIEENRGNLIKLLIESPADLMEMVIPRIRITFARILAFDLYKFARMAGKDVSKIDEICPSGERGLLCLDVVDEDVCVKICGLLFQDLFRPL